MSVAEVAAYLRLKPRKIYDLVARGVIPHARVSGKLLFPLPLIERWIEEHSHPGDLVAGKTTPPIVAGSHDPLLEWAIRESRCNLAQLPGGSSDGLKRLIAREAMIAALHVRDPERHEYNLHLLEPHRARDLVLIEWAKRAQGLVLAPGNPLKLKNLRDLKIKAARVVPRQEGSGSQALLLHLLGHAGLRLGDLKLAAEPALNEDDIGHAVREGQADAGLAIAAVAKQFGLDFLPLTDERFDLALHRRDYFSPAVQTLTAFARTAAFARRAAALSGYDVAATGRVVWNA